MRVVILVLLVAAAPVRSQQETKQARDPVRQAVLRALPPDLAVRGRDGDLSHFLSMLPADQRAAALRALSTDERDLSSSSDVLAQLSEAYLALGSPSQALSAAEEVLTREPRNPDALGVKARLLASRGDMDAARQLLARIPPGHPQAALVVTAIMLGRGQSVEGVRARDGALTAPVAGSQSMTSGVWAQADYERANSEAGRQRRAPGGRLDRSLPDIARNAASESLANTPLGPLAEGPQDKNQSPLRAAAELALVTIGALMLAGGLGARQFEEKYPGIRRSMGIAALVSGGLAAGFGWESHATRFAATTLPLAANPQVEEEGSEALPSVQPLIQRVTPSAADVTPQAEVTVERMGSRVATQASRLLNAEQAQIDVRKFTEYALNPAHPVGFNKAKVFESVLGYTRDDFQGLVDQIRAGLLTNPAIQGAVDRFGTRFTVDIVVRGPAGQAVVRTGWIYSPGSQVPSMTTAFVK